jgi:hypothetical protein
MMGLAFALVPAVLWPAVTYLVPEARLGSAYALMTFCQQIGWSVMSWGMGKVKDAAGASAAHPSGWVPVMWMLAGLALAGRVLVLLARRHGPGPSSSARVGREVWRRGEGGAVRRTVPRGREDGAGHRASLTVAPRWVRLPRDLLGEDCLPPGTGEGPWTGEGGGGVPGTGHRAPSRITRHRERHRALGTGGGRGRRGRNTRHQARHQAPGQKFAFWILVTYSPISTQDLGITR